MFEICWSEEFVCCVKHCRKDSQAESEAARVMGKLKKQRTRRIVESRKEVEQSVDIFIISIRVRVCYSTFYHPQILIYRGWYEETPLKQLIKRAIWTTLDFENSKNKIECQSNVQFNQFIVYFSNQVEKKVGAVTHTVYGTFFFFFFSV